MKKILLLALLLAPLPLLSADIPESQPQNAQQEEVSSVRDRLSTSLFFRGELADKIIDAGMAERFVDLDSLETNAEVRSALLAWIQRNPAKAAAVYLNMKGAGGRMPDRIEIRETTFKFNTSFIASIKALNAAAGSGSVSKETLELAARRLYEGEQAEAEGPEVRAGGANSGGGNAFFSINYADYKLNKAGLGREVAQAGVWLEAARGVGLQVEVKGAYASAFSLYSEFIVAASALKGRDTITEQESRYLENLRVRLRSALSALALRARVSTLAAAAASLEKLGAEPGAKELLLSVGRLKARLESYAARVEAGGMTLGEVGRLVNSAENDFAALYMGYSAYDGLLSLKNKAASSGFSCVYDYAAYRYLAAFFPRSLYPRAKQELAAAAGALDAALLKAGRGDLSGALEGFDPGRAEAAADVVRSASSFNRGAQFFLWGLFFRPFEYKVSIKDGRASFRPAFTVSELARKK
jgi:hypothetical protein